MIVGPLPCYGCCLTPWPRSSQGHPASLTSAPPGVDPVTSTPEEEAVAAQGLAKDVIVGPKAHVYVYLGGNNVKYINVEVAQGLTPERYI